jgi:hypothetical protein
MEEQMKKLKFPLLILIILFISLPSYSGELDKPYSPTRKEWLEISIFKAIKDRTDPWKQHISSVVWLKEEENTIFITLTSANQQEEMKAKAQKEYVEIIQNDVESFIKKYDWAKKLKVHVQFF